MLGLGLDFDFAHFIRSELDFAHSVIGDAWIVTLPLVGCLVSRHCYRYFFFARLLVRLLTDSLLCQLVCSLCALFLALALDRIHVILFS